MAVYEIIYRDNCGWSGCCPHSALRFQSPKLKNRRPLLSSGSVCSLVQLATFKPLAIRLFSTFAFIKPAAGVGRRRMVMLGWISSSKASLGKRTRSFGKALSGCLIGGVLVLSLLVKTEVPSFRAVVNRLSRTTISIGIILSPGIGGTAMVV